MLSTEMGIWFNIIDDVIIPQKQSNTHKPSPKQNRNIKNTDIHNEGAHYIESSTVKLLKP